MAEFAKIINSSATGGRRVPCKNYNFCDFSKNHETLEKSQNLLKLLNSSVRPLTYYEIFVQNSSKIAQ